MARPRSALDPLHQGAQVFARHPREKVGWRRERLLAVKLGLEGELSSKAIAAQLGHSQTTLTTWFNLYRQGDIDGLLEQKQRGKGFAPELDGSQMQELTAELEKAAGAPPRRLTPGSRSVLESSLACRIPIAV